eukprot:12921179-Prorocentrum_lima.AAC.1
MGSKYWVEWEKRRKGNPSFQKEGFDPCSSPSYLLTLCDYVREHKGCPSMSVADRKCLGQIKSHFTARFMQEA